MGDDGDPLVGIPEKSSMAQEARARECVKTKASMVEHGGVISKNPQACHPYAGLDSSAGELVTISFNRMSNSAEFREESRAIHVPDPISNGV